MKQTPIGVSGASGARAGVRAPRVARLVILALAVAAFFAGGGGSGLDQARAESPAVPAPATGAAGATSSAGSESGSVAAGAAATTAPVADPAGALADSTIAQDRVVAYYFYTTKRCASCRKIEAFTREAIETGFPSELKNGRLVWRLVNVDEKGNEMFVKEYQLFTKSVILVDEKDGARGRWKNLPKIWELLNDKPKFIGYVQGETRAFLAGKS